MNEKNDIDMEHVETSSSISQNGKKSVKKNKKEKLSKEKTNFQRVGNFRSYYTYRLGNQFQGILEADSRLRALDRNWFIGKRGLDIGCNSGELTIAIAQLFAPEYFLGIDIDPQLISQARRNIKEYLQRNKVKAAYQAITKDSIHDTNMNNAEINIEESTIKEEHKPIPISFQTWTVNEKTKKRKLPENDVEMNAENRHKCDGATNGAASTKMISFPHNVVFKQEDFMLGRHVAGTLYDFIVCFSVTKWIHLFHGDEGICQLFRQIYSMLQPGGRLFLEPQPWKSYHKRKFTSGVTARIYGEIQIRPKDFPSLLTSEQIGFESCTLLQVCETNAKGFKRPLYLVQKARMPKHNKFVKS